MAADTPRIAVVGAGPGGLCAARWLRERGVAFDVYERQQDVGGIWDMGAPETPMYESARFISSKTLSAFRDFPMPREYPDYPDHRQVLQYLRAYAERHRLREHVRFGSAVAAVRPDATSWRVELETGDSRRYHGVILATGLQWTPKQPELPGTFEGEVLHSARYKSRAQLAGKRVLVVGGGNSGCDIAVDAGEAASRALLSVRRGYWFVPKYIFGVPADVFGHSGPALPGWLEQALFEPLLRVLVGDPRRYGLPKPDHRLFETHPVLNSQILDSLKRGVVAAKPDVQRAEGRRIVFADGSTEDVDLIVFATGFHRTIPVLGPELGRDASQLFLNVFHRSQPGLFVVGFLETDAGSYPLLDLQCELISKVIELRRAEPSRLRSFEARLRGPAPDFSGGVKFLQVERMSNYVRAQPYARYLERTLRELSTEGVS